LEDKTSEDINILEVNYSGGQSGNKSFQESLEEKSKEREESMNLSRGHIEPAQIRAKKLKSSHLS
jgi:hypothetical protein